MYFGTRKVSRFWVQWRWMSSAVSAVLLIVTDKGLDGLTQDVIGHTDDGGFADAFEPAKHILYLFGTDTLAFGFYHVILAAEEV